MHAKATLTVQPFTTQVTRQQIEHVARDPLLIQGWMRWLASSYKYESPLPRSTLEELLLSQADRTRRLTQIMAKSATGGKQSSDSGIIINGLASIDELEDLCTSLLPRPLPASQGGANRQEAERKMIQAYKKMNQPHAKAAQFLLAEVLVVILRLIVCTWVSQLPGSGIYGVNCATLHEQFSFLHAWNASLLGLYLVKPIPDNDRVICGTVPFETAEEIAEQGHGTSQGVFTNTTMSNRYVVSPPLSVLEECHNMMLTDSSEDFNLTLTFPLEQLQEFFMQRGFPPLESVNELLLLYPHWHQQYYKAGGGGPSGGTGGGAVLECIPDHFTVKEPVEGDKSTLSPSLQKEAQKVRSWVVKHTAQQHVVLAGKPKNHSGGDGEKRLMPPPLASAVALSALPIEFQEALLLSSAGKDVRFQLHGDIHVVVVKPPPRKEEDALTSAESFLQPMPRLIVVAAPRVQDLAKVRLQFNQKMEEAPNKVSPSGQLEIMEDLLARQGYCHRGINRNLFHRYFPGVQSPWMAAEAFAFAASSQQSSEPDWERRLSWRSVNRNNADVTSVPAPVLPEGCGAPIVNKSSRAKMMEKLNFGASLETQRRRRWLLHLWEELKREHNSSWRANRKLRLPSNKRLVEIFERRYACKTIPMAVAMDVKLLKLDTIDFGESAEFAVPMIDASRGDSGTSGTVKMDRKDPLTRCKVLRDVFVGLKRDFDGEAPTPNMLLGVLQSTKYPKLKKKQMLRDAKLMGLELSPTPESVNRAIIRQMSNAQQRLDREAGVENCSSHPVTSESGAHGTEQFVSPTPWMLYQVPDVPPLVAGGEEELSTDQPIDDSEEHTVVEESLPQQDIQHNSTEEEDGFLSDIIDDATTKAIDEEMFGDSEDAADAIRNDEESEQKMLALFGEVHPDLLNETTPATPNGRVKSIDDVLNDSLLGETST